MLPIAATILQFRRDTRGHSLLEFVSTLSIIAGIMMVAGTTFGIDPHQVYGSVRASIIGWGR